MRIFYWLRAWLFGCSATLDVEYGPLYCTLDRHHTGDHEAWMCTCDGDGRCTEIREALVETWS
jgi:hypothetical protein